MMVNRQRKILNYIHKYPGITRSAILRAFPDFKEYESISLEYLDIQNEYVDPEEYWELRLSYEASKNNITAGQTPEYIKSHMPENIFMSVPDPDDKKLYYTNLKYQEYIEKQFRENFIFWVPYGLTTFLALASLVFQILNFIFKE